MVCLASVKEVCTSDKITFKASGSKKGLGGIEKESRGRATPGVDEPLEQHEIE
jgi:hypothetical protein